MNRRRNLVVSLVVSIALHGIVVLAVASLTMLGTYEIVPVFKHGNTSVMVTIEQPLPPEKELESPL